MRNSGYHSSGPGPSHEEVEVFIRDNGVDEMAASQLKEADPHVQRSVLDRGSLTDCRNPSAVCLARIRDAKGNRGSGPPSGGGGGGSMYGQYGYANPMYGGNPYGAYAMYGGYNQPPPHQYGGGGYNQPPPPVHHGHGHGHGHGQSMGGPPVHHGHGHGHGQ